jgi:chemotaxis protein methyltransferase CheR
VVVPVMLAKDSRIYDVQDLELQLLLQAIYHHTGYDFREYAPVSLKRRILGIVQKEQLGSISGLQAKVLHDSAFMSRFLESVCVNISAMFRDPGFFLAFRTRIAPLLRGCAFIRIWLAGCSMGEEVYSLAILLKEEGLFERSLIYATDINETELRRARAGLYPTDLIGKYTENYVKAGGRQRFSDYYSRQTDGAVLHPWLKKNVVFAQHNLATDYSFNEFHVVLCRNVMIYFNQSLQRRVHNLIYQSLMLSGVLGMGQKESLRLTPQESKYEELDPTEKLYRKIH